MKHRWLRLLVALWVAAGTFATQHSMAVESSCADPHEDVCRVEHPGSDREAEDHPNDPNSGEPQKHCPCSCHLHLSASPAVPFSAVDFLIERPTANVWDEIATVLPARLVHGCLERPPRL